MVKVGKGNQLKTLLNELSDMLVGPFYFVKDALICGRQCWWKLG